MIDSPEYELAKVMDSLIKPFIPNKHILRSTDDFILKLNNSKSSSDDKLVSFDVYCLYIFFRVCCQMVLISELFQNRNFLNIYIQNI